jgi:hypothetical protein
LLAFAISAAAFYLLSLSLFLFSALVFRLREARALGCGHGLDTDDTREGGVFFLRGWPGPAGGFLLAKWIAVQISRSIPHE